MRANALVARALVGACRRESASGRNTIDIRSRSYGSRYCQDGCGSHYR